MAAPSRCASAIAARVPAISTPRPATTGARHASSSLAASESAACNATGLPSIQAWPICACPVPAGRAGAQLLVVLDIGEALIRLRRALERTSLLARLPVDHVLDLLRQLEVLVGDALGRMVLEADFHPRIGRRDVGVMPRGLGEMADRIDHHQRSLPAVGAVLATDPAAFQIPVRQLTLESLCDLRVRIGAILAAFGHGMPPSIRRVLRFV